MRAPSVLHFFNDDIYVIFLMKQNWFANENRTNQIFYVKHNCKCVNGMISLLLNSILSWAQ